jgi:hypothetical protein
LIVLRNDEMDFGIPAFQVPRQDVADYMHNPLYKYSGYEAYLGAYTLPAGDYAIGVLVINEDQGTLHWTGERHVVP